MPLANRMPTQNQNQNIVEGQDIRVPFQSVAELQQMVFEAEQLDSAHFAEQRKNIHLVAGRHYASQASPNFLESTLNIFRNTDKKIKITQNHLEYISNNKVTNIVKNAPNVQIVANNEKEAQDRKAAQLHNSVWQYIFYTNRLKKFINKLAKDFVDLGECCCIIKWNDDKGHVLQRGDGGYQQIQEGPQQEFNQGRDVLAQSDPEDAFDFRTMMNQGSSQQKQNSLMQMALLSEMSKMMRANQDNLNSLFLGDFEFERVFPMNLLRPSQIDDIDRAEWLGITNLVSKKYLKSKFNVNMSGHGMEFSNHQFFTFNEDAFRSYRMTEDKVKLNEIYWKPTKWMPYGWYAIFAENMLLASDQLPYGIFPIVYSGYLSSQTSPRHHSLLRHLAPYQSEINRCVTEMVRHQISVGSDKLLIEKGSEVSRGISISGVKVLNYAQGTEKPIFLQGKVGEQFFKPLLNQIEQMYHLAGIQYNISLDGQKRDNKTAKDPYAQLFHSMQQREKDLLYVDTFEMFLIDMCRTTLSLAKYYISEDHLIPMIGRNEYVNIAEFKNSTPLDQQVKALPRTDDVNTVMGKQLTLTQALQYVGQQLPPQEVGNVLANMPFLNSTKMFADLTLDYDIAENMILALDRGEQPKLNQFDNAPYMIQKLTARMRQADFGMLSPQIQQSYQQAIGWYQNIIYQKQQQVVRENQGMIPTGGPPVRINQLMSYKNKNGETVQKRVLLPSETIQWVMQQLQKQGLVQQDMQQAQESMFEQVMKAQGGGQQQPQQPPQQQPQQMPFMQ